MERTILGVTLMDSNRSTWISDKIRVKDIVPVAK